MNNPLFSFAIGSYNNYEYIFEAIDSVLNQTYPAIELIVSNDGSPDFKLDEVKKYIEKNRKQNIVRFIVNNNSENLGTVANTEYCRSVSSGEYIMYMSADDCLYDKDVLTKFAEEFSELGPEAMCVSGKVAMCEQDINKVINILPDDNTIKSIKEFSSEEMFSRLSHTFTIPTTSTCYKRKLYDVVGAYDKKYLIIEDAPLYLKMARLGVKFHWLDIIAARHRAGGISHGNAKNLSEAYKKYRYDEILIYKNEVFPYLNLISDTDKKIMLKKWEYIEFAYWDMFERGNANIDVGFVIKHWMMFIRKIAKYLVFNNSSIKHISSVLIMMLCFLKLLESNFISSLGFKDINSFVCTVCDIVIILGVSMLTLIYCLKVVYKIKRRNGADRNG